jgi:hypothetical protein
VTTEDFIIALFVRIENAMKGILKHSQANRYPSEQFCQKAWDSNRTDYCGGPRSTIIDLFSMNR